MLRIPLSLLLVFLAISASQVAQAQSIKSALKVVRENSPSQLEALFDNSNMKKVQASIGKVLADNTVVLGASRSSPEVTAKTMTPLPQQVQGLPVEVTVEKMGADVVLSEIQPAVVSAWNKSRITKEQFPRLDESVKELNDRFQKFITDPDESTQNYNELQKATNEVHDAFLVGYANAADNNRRLDVDELARLYPSFFEFRRKAVYGSDDNYFPEVYEKMYQQSRSVVGITVRGRPTPVASGALIGTDLILTARHVFEEYDPSECEIWFDHELRADRPLDTKVFPIESFIIAGDVCDLHDKPLDFALVKIGPSTKPVAAKRCADWGFRPIPLTKNPCRMDEQVYVMGHPKGNTRTIHDNGRIVFPYLLSRSAKTELDIRVNKEIKDAVDKAPPDDRARTKTDLEKIYSESFKLIDNRYRYVSLVYGPAMGIDSDTFNGDSGAPVGLRRGVGDAAGIVGVFIAGSPDNERFESATWRLHEIVLPVTEIIAQLDIKRPGWRTEFAVQVLPP